MNETTEVWNEIFIEEGDKCQELVKWHKRNFKDKGGDGKGGKLINSKI